jgi:hypothetical protein
MPPALGAIGRYALDIHIATDADDVNMDVMCDEHCGDRLIS